MTSKVMPPEVLRRRAEAREAFLKLCAERGIEAGSQMVNANDVAVTLILKTHELETLTSLLDEAPRRA